MIYRYRALNKYTIAALKNDEFWISSSDTFNDLFDIQIAYNKEIIRQEFCLNNAIRKAYIEKNKKYNYSLLNEYERFLGFIDYICQCFILNIKRKILICSLTQNENNAVMWSHYTNDNKGFVVGYKECEIEKLIGAPLNTVCFKVDYNNDPFDSTALIIDSIKNGITNDVFDMAKSYYFFENIMLHDNCDKRFYLRKTKEWQYESELRFMRFYGKSIGNEHQIIGHIRPSKIIIGQKMPIPDKLNIYKLCMEKGIPMFKAEISWDIKNYGIIINPFTIDDLNDISILINDELKK